MTKTVNDLEWVVCQATVHLLGWEINERKPANVKDPEVLSLISAGMLVVVDDESRALLPQPVEAKSGGNCSSCGG